MKSWDAYFLEMAAHVATKSKDRSTQVGCVIVGPHNEVRSTGYNGFPRGVFDDVEARHERPAKYQWTEHAERNAIFNAARHGTALEGCTLYNAYAPCADCARAIIQAGIIRLVVPGSGLDARWSDTLEVARAMLAEAGVHTTVLL